MQPEYKLNFSGRGHKYTQEEIELVAEVMQNADPLTQSIYRNRFEKKFSEYLGVKHSFAVMNATAALEMAAQICQFEDGDEIIVPAHTFTASVYPFAKHGAKIIWADINPQTRVCDAETISKLITKKTKAILVVHLYGYLADMKEIMQLISGKNIILIEDAAQAIGSEFEDKKAGSFGDMSIFSFHSHKNITTLGEGGMLVCNNEKFAEIIPKLRHNGHTSFNFQQPEYWLPAMSDLDFPELNGKKIWPNNYCLGEVECALGEKLLDRLDLMNEERRKRAIFFIDEFKNNPLISFHREDSKRHNYHQLIAVISSNKRDKFMKIMAEKKKIKCILPYYPLYKNTFYKKLGLDSADCPNTETFFNSMCSLPFQLWMSEDDFKYLTVSVRETLEEI